MLSPQQLAKKVGQKVLFVGVECQYWTVADFGKCARNARAMGYDTISPKRADGGIKWYQTPGHMALERQACLAVGVGYLPFMYCYGPALAAGQIELEVAVAQEMANVCDGMVCMDLEVEWNGQVAAAQELARALKGFKGDIILSTWADPVQQDWLGVIWALNPVVSAWGPQEYTTWLTLQESQLTNDGVPFDKLFPELDMVDLFAGANNPLSAMQTAVNRGHGSIWVWEYLGAMNNPNLARTMAALIGPPVPSAPAPTPNPVKLPSPSHTKKLVWASVVIGEGDTLAGIAQKIGVQNWFQDLYLPNRATLDAVAISHGQPNCNGGNLIYPGTTLRYLHAQ